MSSTDFAGLFTELPLSPELQTVLQELGYEKMTAIQARSVPVLLEGKDLIGQSKTGSGKTAAFTLPVLQNLELKNKTPQAVILCPTRELATQVTTEIRKLGRRYPGLQVVQLTGGQPIQQQAQSLQDGAHILVATPGRLLDILERAVTTVDGLKTLILDEADKMLEMGFEAEIDQVFHRIPRQRQTVLFSATFPEAIQSLSRKYQKKPVQIQIDENNEAPPLIEHFIYDSEPEHKIDTLMRILLSHEAKSTIIFCNQKANVAELTEKFEKEGISCTALHGDLEQRDRNKALMMFRNGSYRILIATDVAARGLDIDDLEMVVNFDLPQQADVYIHRVGRTGRAGRSGKAISLISRWDEIKIHEIEKAVGVPFQRPALGFKNQHGLPRTSVYCQPSMQTLSISGGRKDKIRAGDILGALTSASAGLSASDIGKIEIQDQFAYVALSAHLPHQVVQQLRDLKIKGRKFQIKKLQ